jgi:hypothetical protein
MRHWSEAGDRTHQRTTLANVVDLLVRVNRPELAGILCGWLGTSAGASWSAVTSTVGIQRASELARSGRGMGDREMVRLVLQELEDLSRPDP